MRTLAARSYLVVAIGGAVACNTEAQKAASAPRERSQAIQTTDAASAVEAASAATQPKAASSAPKPRRALCDGALRDGKPLPKKQVSRASVGDASELAEHLRPAGGGWVWVNFWAAWCAPCKEEIPRLKNWERQLSSGGAGFRVAFVSLDDDERQLRQFLQTSADLKSTYWLREGQERDEWLSAANLQADPELPIHLLVDPQGRVRCKVQGAVEDADLPNLSRLLGG